MNIEKKLIDNHGARITDALLASNLTSDAARRILGEVAAIAQGICNRKVDVCDVLDELDSCHCLIGDAQSAKVIVDAIRETVEIYS